MHSDFLEIDGHRLAYRAANGQRPETPIVFLHGITASINFWEPILPDSLLRERPYCTLSLPGHYPSEFPRPIVPAEITPELFDRLLAEAIRRLFPDRKVRLVGWSTGGFAALNLAIRSPQLVERVLSVSGFSRGPWHGLIGAMSRLTQFGPIGRGLFWMAMRQTWHTRRLFRWSLKQGAADKRAFQSFPESGKLLPILQADASRHDARVMARLFQCVPRFDISGRLGEIGIPVWVASGDSDPWISVAETRFLADQIPGSRLILFRGCGHHFFAEAREAWRETIEAFVRENETPALTRGE